jgi:3-oxoacyl-[acyl-carrier-protein] synthase II
MEFRAVETCMGGPAILINTDHSNPRRVVITGAGIVTALGLGWRLNAAGFRAGRTAFRPVTRFDVSRQRVRVAGEVDLPPNLPSTKLTARQTSRLDHATKMLLLAAEEAWQQAGWGAGQELPLVLGTTAGGMALGEAYYRQAVEAPRSHRLQPTRALQYQAHTQARLLADALDFKGPITIISNACASGSDAIGHAWHLIHFGLADRSLAGGHDGLSELVFSGFDSLQLLSPTACRPFDTRRDGLIIGEGAGILALESLESASRRKAEILGEVVGYGTTVDLFHLTQPNPQGDAAVASMTQACDAAKVTPADIDYINAHGTGTQLNDSAEAIAIQRWAGSRTATLPVSSTKANVGHLLGAAGAIEAVVCLMTLREQWLPPELCFEIPDKSCAFPVVREPADAPLNLVLSNSFGFGGANATLVLRRWS